MRKYIEPERSIWSEIVARPSSDRPEIQSRVRNILSRVKNGGDKSLRSLAYEIDGIELSSLEVSPGEFAEADKLVPYSLKNALKTAASNIWKFHKEQMPGTLEVETMPGVKCFRKAVPINKAGLYIPGGTAPLFSTVLMLAIPASIAGCREIVMCTPCGKDGKVHPSVLYAARLCGVGRVFKIGGAQAVGAMAYGTGTVPKADKIFGPGNRYVAEAKRIVSGEGVAVDMFAGPSEVLVMADNSSVPEYVAADLLSQAEHGCDSQVCLLVDNEELAERIEASLRAQLRLLPRKETADEALNGSISVVLHSRGEMVEFANAYAPEHLIISMVDPWGIAWKVNAAGSVFIGNYSPESAGDYASGTNHTLPTSGTASASGGIGVDSFTHYVTYQEISRNGLASLSDAIIKMAVAEGLDAHANAVAIRMEGLSDKTD
ncbi:MAG: histidinol dehydrogenase [Candidatus Cryptobacteroides sp.]